MSFYNLDIVSSVVLQLNNMLPTSRSDNLSEIDLHLLVVFQRK